MRLHNPFKRFPHTGVNAPQRFTAEKLWFNAGYGVFDQIHGEWLKDASGEVYKTHKLLNALMTADDLSNR